MTATTHSLSFSGGLLERGFWLYVWETTPESGGPLYYVGRTGDRSSVNAQSPFNRMGAHLAVRWQGNMLRRHLAEHARIQNDAPTVSSRTAPSFPKLLTVGPTAIAVTASARWKRPSRKPWLTPVTRL